MDWTGIFRSKAVRIDRFAERNFLKKQPRLVCKEWIQDEN